VLLEQIDFLELFKIHVFSKTCFFVSNLHEERRSEECDMEIQEQINLKKTNIQREREDLIKLTFKKFHSILI